MDGAGPQRGRKDGPPDSYLEPLNPHGSPFFFGFQKPFFFQQGKRNGFCRPRKVRTVQNALSGISHSAPLLVLSPRDPLRWARAGTPFLHVVWRVWEAAPRAKTISKLPRRKQCGRRDLSRRPRRRFCQKIINRTRGSDRRRARSSCRSWSWSSAHSAAPAAPAPPEPPPGRPGARGYPRRR